MSKIDCLKALDLLKSGQFQAGPDMEKAHQICQTHTGMADFDWVHALVHRIEGDDGNAAYWYRRAGQARHAGSIEDEWESIRAEVDKRER